MSGSHEDPSPWLVADPEDGETQLRVICFASAGSSARFFANWQDVAPPGMRIVPVLLPGRDSRHAEPPFRRVTPLIEAMGPSVAATLDRPYILFGHSLGSLLAFEFARWLRRRPRLRQPESLWVASRPAPHDPPTYTPVHDLPNDKLLDVLRLYGGTPELVLRDADIMRFMGPMIRADLEMNRLYDYFEEPPLPIDIVAMCGRRDPVVSPQEMEEWRHQTSGRFETHLFDGDHFFLRERAGEILRMMAGATAGTLT